MKIDPGHEMTAVPQRFMGILVRNPISVVSESIPPPPSYAAIAGRCPESTVSVDDLHGH